MKKIILLVFVLFFGAVCAFAQGAAEDKILKQKIAQMLIVGFNGQALSPSNPIYSDIKDLGIGGVILFNKNADITRPNLVKNIKDPEQLKKLTGDLQKISRTPLFIAIDQEGGLVSRLSPSYFIVSIYSARDLGTKNDPVLTLTEAEKTAKTLKDTGVNLNFAPCVDLDINKKSTVISGFRRAYSDNPAVVTAQARAVIKGHDKYGVLTVLKHFPGHGSAAGDTHAGFVDVTKTYDQKELLPYKTLISEGLAHGVLMAHVYDKNIDSEFPASLSKKTIQGTLVGKLGFKGLVFTDDIQMGALKNNFTLEETLKNAINAGNDVIVIGNNLNYDPEAAKKSVEIVYNLVKSGEIPETRIDAAYAKIMEYKNANLGRKN